MNEPAGRATTLPSGRGTTAGTPRATAHLCNRCGFPVMARPWGCKNPCTNCGTVYPLGDCSD
jgi:hypothetical protein